MVTPDEPFEPRVLGPYTLIAPLAHGGMGSVYFAARRDQAPPRALLLVKTLKSSLVEVEDYAGRFIDEARVAVRLRHANLCEVTDAGVAGRDFYLAMELIEGVTFRRLQSLLDQKKLRLTSTEAAALTITLLRGLHAAHTSTDEGGKNLGVVHRDVSPHNVMVDVTGRVKVIDYGLATSVLKETFTESMVALGKSAYMAPEQARGEDVAAAADQYSAAIVFYELLTSDRFYGDMAARAVWSVAGSGTHKPRAWDRVPETFREVLEQALSPDPKQRFATCADFALALVGVCPQAARPDELEAVAALVKQLDAPELKVIAQARATLAALDASDVDVTEKTARAPAGGASDKTEVAPAPKIDDDTASTVIRPRRGATALAAPVRAPRWRAPLLAAFVSVGFTVVVAGVVVVSRSGPPAAKAAPAAPLPPVPSIASVTSLPSPTLRPVPVGSGLIEGEPTPPTPTAPTIVEPRRQDDARRRERLIQHARRVLGGDIEPACLDEKRRVELVLETLTPEKFARLSKDLRDIEAGCPD